jgi:hypothetical protein
MPEGLVLVGLVIATILYALLIRRRSSIRAGVQSMAKALSASNEVAMARIRSTFRSEPEGSALTRVPGDRRSGEDRRKFIDRRIGRGRRSGGDRRQARPSS